MNQVVLQGLDAGSSSIVSWLSLFISAGVFVKYIFEYRQQNENLEKQKEQIENQAEQLEAQREQIETQQQQLRQHKQELEEISEQTRLAKLEHQPHIEVDDYKFDGDTIILTLSNNGNGTGVELCLKSVITDDVAEHPSLCEGFAPLNRRGIDNERFNNHSIRAGEQQVKFEADPMIGVENGRSSSQQSLRGTLLDIAAGDEKESIGVKFKLVTHSLGEQQAEKAVTQAPISIDVDSVGYQTQLEGALRQQVRF